VKLPEANIAYDPDIWIFLGIDVAIRFFLVARCGETRSLQATGKVKPRIAGGFFDKGDG